METWVNAKLKELPDWKYELDTKLKLIDDMLDAVKDSIREKMYDETDNPDGLLLQELNMYLECFTLKRE